MSGTIIELNEETATDKDKAVASVLDMLSESKPYAFIVASIEGEDENQHLKLELDTNIPAEDLHILKFMLEGSLHNLHKE